MVLSLGDFILMCCTKKYILMKTKTFISCKILKLLTQYNSLIKVDFKNNSTTTTTKKLLNSMVFNLVNHNNY